MSPPLAILDHAQVLREIMVVYESSLPDEPEGGDDDDDEGSTTHASFREILDKMVDPAIDMCLAASEEKKRLRPGWDASVFVLNSLSWLQAVLEQFGRFTGEKLGVIKGVVENRVEVLTEEHVSCCCSLALLVPHAIFIFLSDSTRTYLLKLVWQML